MQSNKDEKCMRNLGKIDGKLESARYLKEGERLDDLQYADMYIIQHKDKYAFTSDAVILANLVRESGKGVDLCSGSGVIGILVGAKRRACVTMVEIQPDMADMCERSLKLNGIDDACVINKPLQNINEVIGRNSYDFVTCNPPYKKRGTGKALGKHALSRDEVAVTMDEIVAEGSMLLKSGGAMYMCAKEERMAELIYTMQKYKLETKEIYIRPTTTQSVVFIRAVKDAKSGMKLILMKERQCCI